MDRQRHPRGFPVLLRRQGAPARAEFVAGAAWGRYPAVYECGDEPVQGRFPRPRKARLRAGNDGAEMRARGREAQRPGKCGLYEAASHVFRDAGQFLVWRLFQEGCDWLRLGADYLAAMVWNPERKTLRHHLWRRGAYFSC